MPNQLDTIIQTAAAQTVQSQVSAKTQGGISPIWWLARGSSAVSAWWSPARDRDLRTFWKQSDHLSGAIYAMQAKMTAIPFQIVPRDPSNKRHAKQAEQLTEIMYGAAQFGEGWAAFYGRWVEDLLTCDNGCFAEVIGMGDKNGPIVGMPLSVAHLDSHRCQRTGNAEYPVLYQDTDGRQYKLHRSRVIFTAQMGSPIAEMFGVGFSACSRCINVAQTLIDILSYQQEKLGSRPHRAILITKGGLDPTDVQNAFQMAESTMDSQGLSRYSRVVVAGSSSMQEAGIDVIELSSLPDGFDYNTSVTLGMATIALALGVDARELFPAMSAGATRADALLQHLKQRGKGPGQIIQATELAFNYKYLPQHLQMVFDFQDDAQDRQVADIRLVRANRRTQDTTSGSVNVRTIREQMMGEGDLTRAQFERLELSDGRLPEGESVLTLFYSTDSKYTQYLDLGVSDPLDIESNDALAIEALIVERMAEIYKVIANTTDYDEKQLARQALNALIYLHKHYQDPEGSLQITLGEYAPVAGDTGNDQRVRNIDLTSPNADEDAGAGKTQDIAEQQNHPDDRPQPDRTARPAKKTTGKR